MSNPISGTVDARPDRPDYPWRYTATNWGLGSYRIATVGDDETHWSFCITSIHLTSYALTGTNNFRLTHHHDGIEEQVLKTYQGGLGMESLLFPTPLVIESAYSWNLNGQRITQDPQDQFLVTMVGFWAPNDLRSDQRDLRLEQRDLRSDQPSHRAVDPLQPPSRRSIRPSTSDPITGESTVVP